MGISSLTWMPSIAAIAIANDLPLFTCNPDDFAGIDGLTVVEVPHPDNDVSPSLPHRRRA